MEAAAIDSMLTPRPNYLNKTMLGSCATTELKINDNLVQVNAEHCSPLTGRDRGGGNVSMTTCCMVFSNNILRNGVHDVI